MDNRKPLTPGTVLEYLGMSYTLEEEIGRGSNSIVYKGRYPDHLNTLEWHTVLIKEMFPLHPSGAIHRDQDYAIVVEQDGEALWQEHCQSFEKGNRIHLQMLQSFPDEIGVNINSFPLNNTFYSILGFTGGRSLAEDQSHGMQPLRKVAVRMLGLLDSLRCFHEEGYLHLDIAPDNILLLGSGSRERVMLIDYNSVHSLQPDGNGAEVFSTKNGYTAPEIRTGHYADISFASDLYSAAAVFYEALTGTKLTSFQMSRPNPPDVSGAPLLRGQPDTVHSMVRQILTRGLAALPRRRYQTIAAMRQDLEELIDRIDGVGITHCALWEAGRRGIDEVIRNNPAFSFLKNSGELFSVSVKRENGETQPIGACLASLKEANGKNLILTGEGGAGKTTALQRFVLSSQEKYSPMQPAVLYISLYGKKITGTGFLDLILENLRFKLETGSFEEARHALTRLMDTPLQTPRGELPTLVLLLDGLNEYDGPRDQLLSELVSLTRLKGLKLLMTSRSPEAGLPVETAALLGLEDTEILRALQARGLAVPQAPSMRELIRNPLMLSIYILSAEAKNGQLLISDEEELLQIYFSSLLEKEKRLLPDDSDEHWLLDASVRLVLPAVAEEVRKRGRPLSDKELLPLAGNLFRLTKTRLLFRLFPEWVGHTEAVRGKAKTAEEWYGLTVHRILWKRLALLVRMEQDMYQLPHMVIRDYLSAIDRNNARKLRKRQTSRRIGAVLLAAFLLCGTGLYVSTLLRPKPPAPYDPEYAEIVFASGEIMYGNAVKRAELLHALAEAAAFPESYASSLEKYQLTAASIHHSAQTAYYSEIGNDRIEREIDGLLNSGEVFSGSGVPLDKTNYRDLIDLEKKLDESYAQYVDTLTLLVENDYLNGKFGDEYRAQLKALADADAELGGVFYLLTIGRSDADLIADPNSLLGDLHYTSTYQTERIRSALSSSADGLGILLNEARGKRESCMSELDSLKLQILDMHARRR